MKKGLHICCMKTGSPAFIYALFNGNDPVYVGKTTRPANRQKEHVREFKKRGICIEMVILEEIRWGVGSEYWEKFYYSLFKSFGFNLQQNMRLRKPGTGSSTYKVKCKCKFRYETKDVVICLSKIGYASTDLWIAVDEESKIRIIKQAVFEKERIRPIKIIEHGFLNQQIDIEYRTKLNNRK